MGLKENEELLKYFKFEHLPEKLQSISKPFGELAQQIYVRDVVGASCETGFALRKLLEAKDCAVRAML